MLICLEGPRAGEVKIYSNGIPWESLDCCGGVGAGGEGNVSIEESDETNDSLNDPH